MNRARGLCIKRSGVFSAKKHAPCDSLPRSRGPNEGRGILREAPGANEKYPGSPHVSVQEIVPFSGSCNSLSPWCWLEPAV